MTIEALKSDLIASRDHLFDCIRGLSEEQFRQRGDDGWSIAAHLAHLLRIERIFADRAAAALREDGVFCPSTRQANDDDPALAQRLAVPQIIHGLQASRRDLTAVLDTGDAVLERAITHERLGRMTVEQIAEKMSSHEREHAVEIAGLARQAQAARRVTIPLQPRS